MLCMLFIHINFQCSFVFVFKRVQCFGGLSLWGCRACAWVEDLLTTIKVILIKIINQSGHAMDVTTIFWITPTTKAIFSLFSMCYK